MIKSKIQSYLDSITVSDKIVKDVGRVYSINELKFPSVTTVLGATADKSFLDDWKARVGEEAANEITETAARRGSSFHQLLEDHFNGIDIDKSAEGYPLFNQVRTFIRNIDPVAIEIPLFSSRYKVAGRADFIGIRKGKLILFDWKTSKRHKNKSDILDYFHQTALYSFMLFEQTRIKVDEIEIVMGVDNSFPLKFNVKPMEYIPDAIKRVEEYYLQNADLML